MRRVIFGSFLLVILAIFVAGCTDGVSTANQCAQLDSEVSQDACCAEINKDTPHVQCEGSWQFVSGTGTCQFVCDGAVACPEDAKICPDGSAVGREGPNCEFAACPEEVDVPEEEVREICCGTTCYDLHPVGFCARALLPEGTACIITDIGDVIVPGEQESVVRSCLITCEQDAPITMTDSCGEHTCFCSESGIACTEECTAPVVDLESLSLGGSCTSDADCATGGCSGQICGTKAEVETVVTTCEYREEYQCLQDGSCGCIAGTCQWNADEVNECLEAL